MDFSAKIETSYVFLFINVEQFLLYKNATTYCDKNEIFGQKLTFLLKYK
jgi:hypothetical protein